MNRFKPIRQDRVSEKVYDQLRQTILQGLFKPGDKLPSERDLAYQFQVSRVAVREALRALETSGFVVTRQGASGGAYVIELSFEHLSTAFMNLFLVGKISIPELHQVRFLVEPQVARIAALNMTPEYEERLKGALAAEDLHPTSWSEEHDIKTRVHLLLAEMCGNRFFDALIRSAMRLTRQVIEAVQPNSLYLHPAGMHRPIVEAVLASDGEAASAAMKRHTIEFGEILIKMEKVYREKTSLVSNLG